MPYVPKFKHLTKILFGQRDVAAAEGLWFEGTWLHEQGDTEGARQAFHHSRLLDRQFGGAYYNYAALTEKLRGAKSEETLRAWKDYLEVAVNDKRQTAMVVEKVRSHVRDIEKAMGKSSLPTEKG
ncbi:hypothetical protein IT570_04815 [Candidatus Sumerlaeota bacterium]|nr:hypothetical protein [Candidatus Sumerlaeota bacterium]